MIGSDAAPAAASPWMIFRDPLSARTMQLFRSSWPHLITILMVGLAVSVPIVLWGFCLGEPIHLIWARHFAEQLWSGELYPRWLMDMNSGLGSPTFFFYGSIPFYVSSLLQTVVSQGDLGWPAIGLSASLALVASAFAAFAWLRQVVEETALWPAPWPTCSCRITWNDHLVRFAFAECWALVWLPWCLPARTAACWATSVRWCHWLWRTRFSS
jgi:hypothetical protein